MADAWITNFVGTGAQCIWELISTILTQSGSLATFVSSGTQYAGSDGTTYPVQITSGGSGAGGLAKNTKTWVVVNMADGSQICFQRGTDNQHWRVTRSKGALFIVSNVVQGSPSLTQAPTASDQVTLVGAGTEASPTFLSWFGTDSTYNFIGQVADNSRVTPWGFWTAGYALSGRAIGHAFMMEPLTTPAGTDPDPYVFYAASASYPLNVQTSSSGTPSLNSYAAGSGSQIGGPQGYIGGTTSWVQLAAPTLSIVGASVNQICVPQALTQDPINSEDDNVPVLWLRDVSQGSPTGFKGVSVLARWCGSQRSTAYTSDSKARVVIGALSLPWNGTTTPT